MSRSASGWVLRRQWPIWTLAAVALVWLVTALINNWPAAPAPLQGLVALLGNAGPVFPPLLLLLLIAAYLPIGRTDPDADALEERIAVALQTAGQLEEQLGRIDSTLGSCAARVEEMSRTAGREGDGLVATAGALEVAAGTMALASADLDRAAAVLQETLPGVTAQARDAESLLRTAGGQATLQIQAVDGALAAIAARSTDAGIQAETSIAAMQKLLAQIDATSSETTKAIANRAYALDAAVTGVLDRSAAAFGSIGETLQDYAGRFEKLIADARAEVDDFGSEGARAIGQRLDVLLGAAGQLKQQFGEHLALADQVQGRALDHVEQIQGRLAALNAAQGESAEGLRRRFEADLAALEARLEALRAAQQAAADAAAERSAAGLDSLSARLAAFDSERSVAARQATEGALAGVEALETRLAAFGSAQAASRQELEEALAAAIAAIEGELAGLRHRQADIAPALEAQYAELIAGLEARLAGLGESQRALAAAVTADLERGIGAVEARLALLRDDIEGRFAETGAGVDATLEGLERLRGALAGRQETVELLGRQIADLRPMLAEFAQEAERQMPRLGDAFDSVSDRGQAMLSQLDDLRDRIDSQSALLRDSAAAFERDHEAIIGLSQTLAGHFSEARSIVGDIHDSTEQTAIAAASRMVENVLQVRQSVNATSAEIRALLGEVVADAEKALDDFASNKAEAAFGAPIRLQIASLEDAALRAADAASAASEQLSGRLLDLLRTIAETEARIDEVDTRMDVRARDTLAARSLRLIESLTEESIDVAKLLAVDVGDNAWDRYLKGDRSLFARATVRLADKETSRKIARHFTHDEPFREEAARYCDQFETLIRRVLKDPDGESFALILLSSDIGKLYVLIAQAIGRPVAKRED
jgi:hypothetical protein